MYVVDASVWVSRFLPTDAYYRQSRAWLEGQVDRGGLLAAPSVLLPELAGAVARRTGRPELGNQAVALLQRLPNGRLISVDADLAQLSASVAATLHLRGVDAVYVALAQALGFALVTWDREQRERSEPLLTAVTPAQVLQE